MTKLVRRLRYMLRNEQIEADLAEEMEFHRAMLQAEEAQGDEHADQRAMGNVTLAREDARAVWIWPWLESLWQDVVYALRGLGRQPGFTLVALGTLGAALGLNASLFTVFDVLILEPWPVKEPARVVQVARERPGPLFSDEEYRYLSDHARSFAGLVFSMDGSLRLEDGEVRASYVSGNYFDVFGTEMVRGRSLEPEDDRMDAPQAKAVIAYQAWQTRFGADPDVVGRQVRLSGVFVTIVGVASREFTGNSLKGVDVWLPRSAIALFVSPVTGPIDKQGQIAGRLAPGVSRQRALAELMVLIRQFREGAALPGEAAPGNQLTLLDARLDPLHVTYRRLAPLFAGVGLVLLLACANVGNLLLARGAARSHEMAVRVSLGAGRRRLVRQLLTESLVLAIGAGVLAIAIACVLPTYVMQRFHEASNLSGYAGIRPQPNGIVLAFTAGLCLLTCIAFGLIPALRTTQVDRTGALKDPDGSSRRRLSVRGALLSVQVAVSVVLLVDAGRLLRAVHRAARQDLGFATKGLSLLSFYLPPSYELERIRAFSVQLFHELESLPGAKPLGYMTRPPFTSERLTASGLYLPGQNVSKERRFEAISVSPGYFEVLRIPVVAGRNFEPDDAYRGIIVNEALAQEYWPGQNPVGREVMAARMRRTVVGVVKNADTQAEALRLRQVPPRIYWPVILPAVHWVPRIVIPSSDPESWQPLATVASRIDPQVQLQLGPLSRNFDQRLGSSRVAAWVATALGAIALALACVGIAGVFAYVVQRRVREIGIRMAVGAQPGHVLRDVLGSSLRAVLIGLGVGLIAALASSSLLVANLYGLRPFDPAIDAVVAGILFLAALIATYFPARRALRVDPAVALRWD